MLTFSFDCLNVNVRRSNIFNHCSVGFKLEGVKKKGTVMSKLSENGMKMLA